jgi:hypothetical protein
VQCHSNFLFQWVSSYVGTGVPRSAMPANQELKSANGR